MALSDYQQAAHNASSGLRAIGYLGDLPDNLKYLAEDGDFLDWAKTVRNTIGASNRAFSTVDGLTKAYQAYKSGATASSVAKSFSSGKGWISQIPGGRTIAKAMPWFGLGVSLADIAMNGMNYDNTSSAITSGVIAAGASPWAAAVNVPLIGKTVEAGMHFISGGKIGGKSKPDFYGPDATKKWNGIQDASGKYYIYAGDSPDYASSLTRGNKLGGLFMYDPETNLLYYPHYHTESESDMTEGGVNEYNVIDGWAPATIVQKDGKLYVKESGHRRADYFDLSGIQNTFARVDKKLPYNPYMRTVTNPGDDGMSENDYIPPTYNTPVSPIMSDGLDEGGTIEPIDYTLNEGWKRYGDDAYNVNTKQLIPNYFHGREYDDILHTSEDSFNVEYVDSDPLGGAGTQPPPTDPNAGISPEEENMTVTYNNIQYTLKDDGQFYDSDNNPTGAYYGDNNTIVVDGNVVGTIDDNGVATVVNQPPDPPDQPSAPLEEEMQSQGNADTGSQPSSDDNLISQIEAELGLPAGSFATYSQQYNDELSNAISELGRISTASIPYQRMNLVPIGASKVANERVRSLASLLDPNEVSAKMASQRDNLITQGDIKSRLQQEQADIDSRLLDQRLNAGDDPGWREELAKWLMFGRAANQVTGGAASGWVKKAIDRVLHKRSVATGLSGVGDSANYEDFTFDDLNLPDRWWDMNDDEIGQYLDDSGIFGSGGESVIGNLDVGNYGLGTGDLSVFDSFEPEDLDWAVQNFDFGYDDSDFGNLDY